MAPATLAKRMTAEEFLALPENGMDRWLIDGRLREKPMTYRNRFHSAIMAKLSMLLGVWQAQQPKPRTILCGEAGVRFGSDTVVGIDVVVVSAEVMAQQADDSTIIVGTPLLAVEILSPSDTVEEVHEKTQKYLKAGVPLVWIIDPYERSVTIHQPGARPRFVNEDQELEGDSVLPGFMVSLAKLFE